MSGILIKNLSIFSPEPLGINDILIINDRIVAIEKNITLPSWLSDCTIINGENLHAVPGFIDAHVHITGGGGEAGFASKVPSVQLSSLIRGGITTVGGLLGTDSVTRNLESVLAQAYTLEEEGMSTFIFSGGYPVPSPNITGSIRSDMAYIEKVRGGKIAIADHRVSPVSLETFFNVAMEARIGGMLCGYAGMLIIHVGSTKEGLSVAFQAIEQLPQLSRHLVATHINRNEAVFMQAVELAKKGGFMDISSGLNTQTLGTETLKPSEAIKKAYELGVPKEHILMSSDGNGSAARYGDDGSVTGLCASSLSSLHSEFVDCVKEGMSITDALCPITKNVAKAFSLEGKGELLVNALADIVLLDSDYALHSVIAKGKIMMEGGVLQKKGTFE